MKRTPYYSLILLFLVVLAIAVACSKSKKEPIVAVVGGEDIPLSVVNGFFDKIGATFTSADEEYRAKRDALDSLIDYKLMVKGAYSAGLDKDAEVDQLVNADKTNFMFDELYRQEIVPKIQVTDKEVDEFWDRLQTEYHFAHILVTSKSQADSIEAELKRGADFGAIARTLSEDQASAVKGGDLGFASWGSQLDESFRDAGFSLQVGQVSAPVKTPYGWHIIKVIETRPAQNIGTKEQLYPIIRELIKSRKSNTAESEFLRQIEEKAKVEINPEATQMLIDRLNEFYPKQLGGAQRPDNYFPQIDLLKPFERQMVLASYQGGEVTVEDYLKKIANVQEAFRPRFDKPDSLKAIIFQLELRNIMEYEAGQRNVEQEADYQKRLTEFREGIMNDKFRRSILTKDVTASENEVTQYYDSHTQEFTTPMAYHLMEIELDSSLEASRVHQQLTAGADFGTLASQYTVRVGGRQNKGDIGFVTVVSFPKLCEAARVLEKGQLSDVIQNDEGKFSIIKLVDAKQPMLVPLDSVSGQVKAKVMETKRVNLTLDWLKQQRAKTDIKIFEDVLRNSIDKSKYEKKS